MRSRSTRSAKIAGQLTQIQIDNLGIDYMQRRGAMIDAVTVADAKRVAKRLYGGGMLVTVAGRPKGLVSSGKRGGSAAGVTGTSAANLPSWPGLSRPSRLGRQACILIRMPATIAGMTTEKPAPCPSSNPSTARSKSTSARMAFPTPP